MKYEPIEVAVSITVKALVRGHSVEQIERDCEKLRVGLIARTDGDKDTKDIVVEYSCAEISGLSVEA